MPSSTPTFDRLASESMTIEFNPKWLDESGHYYGAVIGEHAPILALGQVRTCKDKSHRRLVIIGTGITSVVDEKFTNIVFYDRYSDTVNDIAMNCTAWFSGSMCSSFGLELRLLVTEETLLKFCKVFADGTNNLNPLDD